MITTFIIVFGGYLIVSVSTLSACTQQSMYKSIQVICAGIPEKDEWQKINNSATHVLMTCSKATDKIAETLENNQFNDLKIITFFYIKNCRLLSFPKEYFRHLSHLESVVWDNLPVEILEKNLFRNSSNLLEITIVRLKQLKKISSRFMAHQNKLRKLHIIESNVSAEELRPTLTAVYVTLNNLYWRKNKQKLYFPRSYFRDFVFDNLVLENNNIDNTDFLFHVRTKCLSLKQNPISLFKKFSLPRLQGLESLNLASTGLVGTFPDGGNSLIHPTIKELIVSGNRIEALPSNIDLILPSIKVLDVRNNRLSTLPSTLRHMLTKNFGRLLHEGNMFHCNCELRWVTLGYPLLANTIICRTRSAINGKQLSNKTLKKVNLESGLLCRAPEVQLELDEQYRDREYSVMTEGKDMKVYTIELEFNKTVTWRCEGRGDPAPTLKWVSEGQAVKVTKSPLRKYEHSTVMERITVGRNRNAQVFSCLASNSEGETGIKLIVLRVDNVEIHPARIISKTRSYANANQLSFTVIFLVIILLLFMLI